MRVVSWPSVPRIPPPIPSTAAVEGGCVASCDVRPRGLHCLLVLLLLSLLCSLPRCLGSRQQRHSVWYNGLMITGIAVDEATGDVFFSDAVANRVIHQSVNGTVIHVYDKCGFFSPMQLAYHNGKLYVALSTDSRLGVIDVQKRSVSFSSSSPHLSASNALVVNEATGDVVAVDGWGMHINLWSPFKDRWSAWADASPLPINYLASVAMQPTLVGAITVYLVEPSVQRLFTQSLDRSMSAPAPSLMHGMSHNDSFTAGYDEPRRVLLSAFQYYAVNESTKWMYFLLQRAEDEPMQVALVDLTEIGQRDTLISNWTALGRGGAFTPFYGWGMYVDHKQNMYISDRPRQGVDSQKSPYGRVAKIALNGSEVGEWSMSDGIAYSFTSVVYYKYPAGGGSCAYWMADAEKGLVRVAADGTVLLPFEEAPIDPADNRTARFTGMATDTDTQSYVSTLVLLDISDPSTTKLWRFLPYSGSYLLLNTSAAQLGANITGVAVNLISHDIYLSDTRTRGVIRVSAGGELDAAFNTTWAGLVEPSGLTVRYPQSDLFVADSSYNGAGAVIRLDLAAQQITVINNTSNVMWRPLSVALDTSNSKLYISDTNGYIYQHNLETYAMQTLHQPCPASYNIRSMTVNAKGNVYGVDAWSRRLIVVMALQNGWDWGDDCVPPMSSSSSSSSGSLMPVSPTQSSAALMIGLAVLGVVATAIGASCVYLRWRKVQQQRRTFEATQLGERLLQAAEQEEQHYGEHYRPLGWSQHEVVTSADNQDAERDTAHDSTASVAVVDPPVALYTALVDADGEDAVHTPEAAVARRYDYYVAHYEVVATVSDKQQLDSSAQEQPQTTHVSPGQPLSIHIRHSTLQLPVATKLLSRTASPTPSTASARSVSSHSPASRYTSSSDQSTSNPSEYAEHLSGSTTGTDPVTSSAIPSPPHIAELQSTWRSTPTFISSVTDLTILGEGSSGIVYKGKYRDIACVVKLPKSVALTGAAWREWHCHLCLPPHPNLVRFQGALPMSATNYLVLGFVRQGSLHSLLRSHNSIYRRPYGVMRCMRDMSAVLHHIHVAGVVHRDVSCRNILVDSDGSMVLADLGLAEQQQSVSDDGQPRAVDDAKTAVPVRWTSPESLQTQRYDNKSDVWSLGVALWECTVGGRLPYKEQPNTKACIRPIIARQLRLHVDDTWGRPAVGVVSEAEWKLAGVVSRLIRLCLTFDVKHRPDSGQLVAIVQKEWEEWKQEAGSDAELLESEWEQHHAEVQRLLGPPTDHGGGVAATNASSASSE